MDLSRRSFLSTAAALPLVAENFVGAKVTLARELPRQTTILEGHKTWTLVRPHVLGWMSLEEAAMGLPGPWQEYLASWWVEGSKVHMPVITLDEREKVPGLPEGFLGAKLNSGYLMHLDGERDGDCWKPFYDKWNREVAVPLYGREIHTQNLGAAILTNIHLFRMALRYSLPKIGD